MSTNKATVGEAEGAKPVLVKVGDNEAVIAGGADRPVTSFKFKKEGGVDLVCDPDHPVALQAKEKAKEQELSFVNEMALETIADGASEGEHRKVQVASRLSPQVGSPKARNTFAMEACDLPGDQGALLLALDPQDGVEAMLATQMAAVHHATLCAARRIEMCDYMDQAKYQESALNRLARTFTAQMEALRKHRNKGTQTVRHVHVNEGGQAIVADTVSTTHVNQGEG